MSIKPNVNGRIATSFIIFEFFGLILKLKILFNIEMYAIHIYYLV